MNKKVILSICIPTYNGGKRLTANVKRILNCGREDIEIVISDNASTDTSMIELKKINDKRLKLFQNEENIGPLKNGINALLHGSGKYLMPLLDRDILQIEYLDEYIAMLEKEDVGVILNMPQYRGKGENRILNRGESIYWLTLSPHPSYYTYLNEAFSRIEKYSTDGYYPAYCGLSILNDYKTFLYRENPIMVTTEREYILMHASRTWKFEIDAHGLESTKKEHGFEPGVNVGRFRNYVCFMKKNLRDFGNKDIIQVYKSTLEAASPGNYYSVIDTMSKHRYHVDDNGYTLEEYAQIPFNFYCEAQKVLKELGMDEADVLAEMKEITEQNHREFCELVYG